MEVPQTHEHVAVARLLEAERCLIALKLEKYAVLQPSQAEIAFGEEVAGTCGRVKDGDAADLLMQVLERTGPRAARDGLGAGLLELSLEAVEEERVYDLVDVLLMFTKKWSE